MSAWDNLPPELQDQFNDLATANNIPLDTFNMSASAVATIMNADKYRDVENGIIRYSLSATSLDGKTLSDCDLSITHREDGSTWISRVFRWNPARLNLSQGEVDALVFLFMEQNNIEAKAVA